MMEFIQLDRSKNQRLIQDNFAGIELYLKREDLIHPYISGNKYRKLKYNLIAAKQQKVNTILTFGGAFSNHIAAVASVGDAMGFKTIGVIRGEELQSKINENPTLVYAKNCGMQFHFVSRDVYKTKTSGTFLNGLKETYGDVFLIPEGGTNNLAIKGCGEILHEVDKTFDYVCCSVGTGGTLCGIINSANTDQEILGFPALKGDFLNQDICKFAKPSNWKLMHDYHFGGYAKINADLVTFINQFKQQHQIQLDPIYTGKMMFGIFDLIQREYFRKGSKILAIHTGGQQGIAGMNNLLKKKQLPLID